MENEREIKKFKDKQALERAYGALEREFTRKCQRLRELERLLGTMEEKSTPSSGRNCVGNGSVLPQTEQSAPPPSKGTDDPDLKVGSRGEILSERQEENESLLLGRILNDSVLTAKIVAEYVRRQNYYRLPTVMGGGGAFCRAPERRPKSLEEASEMAKSILFRN